MSELDIINIINVSVSEAPIGLSDYKVNNIAYFTNETPIVGLEAYGDYGVYVSPAAVAEAFGSDSETYKAANAIFAQNPNMGVGSGVLIIFPMLTLDAGAVSSADIHTAGSGYSIGDVLTVIQSGGSLCTLTVTNVDTDGEVLAFEITTAGSGYSTTAGTDLATSVAPSGGSGCTVNILTVGSGAETLLQAVTRCRSMIYFVGILSNAYPTSDEDRQALSNAIQGYSDKMLALPSADSDDITGIFTDIKDASNSHTRCLYYGGTAQEARLFAAAAFGRGMGVNFDGSRTTNTLHMKPLATIDPDDTVDQTLLTALETAGVDAYVNVAGISMYWSNGANRYFDEVFNLIWFVSQLKVNGFNALRELSTKIPQTEPGMVMLKGAYRLACEQGIRNGMIAPGSWTSAEWFGNQEDMYSNIEERGYYIYSLPVNQQSSSDRADRKAPVVQIGIKLAGALHSSEVMVNFNR